MAETGSVLIKPQFFGSVHPDRPEEGQITAIGNFFNGVPRPTLAERSEWCAQRGIPKPNGRV